MKTAFVLSGFSRTSLDSTAHNYDGYDQLKSGLRRKGYRVVAIDISWRRKSLSRYIKEFVALYEKEKSQENIVIGNSFGAVIAFVTAPILQPNIVYLCSLSPFFQEDRGKQPDAVGLRLCGKRRMQELWSISATKIASRLNQTSVKTIVVFGKKEYDMLVLVERCKKTATQLHGSKLVEIPNAPHNMGDAAYSSGLLRLIK